MSVRGEIARILVLLLLVVSVWLVSYQGQARLVRSQQAGCERGKRDRAANARAWRQAEEARRADGDTQVADLYADVAADLEKRAALNCADVYPKPSPLSL